MAKLTLTDLGNLENQTTATNTINTNNSAIEDAFENTLSRDGTSPNPMLADLDMNSNSILNLPNAVDDTEPVPLAQLLDMFEGVGAGGIIDAEHILVSHNSTLTADRILAAGSGITLTDGGAKGNMTVSQTPIAARSIVGNLSSSSAVPAAFAVADVTAKTPTNSDYILGFDQAASGTPKKFLVSDVAGIGSVSSFNGMNGAVTTSLSGDIFNLGIATSVAGSALTIALKTAANADASASSPVTITYRGITGDPTTLSVTAASSITIPSTATMGFTNNTPAHILVGGFNDAGTFRLGVYTSSASGTIYPIGTTCIASSTAITTAADNAGVWYTGSAVTSKEFVILARLSYTATPLATAGTWANVPDIIELVSRNFRYPGEIIQVKQTSSTANTQATTQIPIDDTIPQDTEGGSCPLNVSITPTSQANWLALQSCLYVGTASVAHAITAMFQNVVASAIATSLGFNSTAATVTPQVINVTILANSVSAQTFAMRFGANTGNAGLNGNTSSRYLGGTLTSWISATELQG